MKIIHVGSASVHVTSFIEAFQKEQLAHYLITDEHASDWVKSELIVDLRSMNPIKLKANLAKVKAYFQLVKPDIIHIHQINRMAFWVSKVARKLNIPIISTAWGSDVLLMPQKNPIFKYIVKQTLKNSNIITADAHEMITAMSNLVHDKNYVRIQYGIEPICGLEKSKIIYSNRLHNSLYRITTIIDYFNEFIQNETDWKLIIAGSGTETDALRQKVVDLKLDEKVEFVGWLNATENRKNYQTAAIYISVPESDGTSVSLLEAMSAGCIPVVSDLPANREWIEDGVNGILDTSNVNPLKRALALNTSEVEKINTKLITTHATREASIETFLGLYKELIKKSN